jgi:hypothetical protein
MTRITIINPTTTHISFNTIQGDNTTVQ